MCDRTTTHGRDSSVSEFDGRVRIPVTNHMVDVAQLVERQIVALVVMGSIPIIHPSIPPRSSIGRAAGLYPVLAPD